MVQVYRDVKKDQVGVGVHVHIWVGRIICLEAGVKPLGACQFGQTLASDVGNEGEGEGESRLWIPVELLM